MNNLIILVIININKASNNNLPIFFYKEIFQDCLSLIVRFWYMK